MKKVLITGAGRGIGLGLAKIFSENSWMVYGTYRDEKKSQGLLDLSQSQKSVQIFKADVTDSDSLLSIKKKIQNEAPIDILINNSGVIGHSKKSLFDLNLDEVEKVFQVNTLGPLRVTQTFLPLVNPEGKIAQISSLMGSLKDNASGGYHDYRMSKAALNMFNVCLSKEFPKMTCLTLHPGWVQTDMGGTGAQVPVAESVRGLFKVITESNSEKTGKFFNYLGNELPW